MRFGEIGDYSFVINLKLLESYRCTCPEHECSCNNEAPRNSVSCGSGGGLNTDCEDIYDCVLIVNAKGGATAIMSGYLVLIFVFFLYEQNSFLRLYYLSILGFIIIKDELLMIL